MIRSSSLFKSDDLFRFFFLVVLTIMVWSWLSEWLYQATAYGANHVTNYCLVHDKKLAWQLMYVSFRLQRKRERQASQIFLSIFALLLLHAQRTAGNKRRHYIAEARTSTCSAAFQIKAFMYFKGHVPTLFWLNSTRSSGAYWLSKSWLATGECLQVYGFF